MRNGLLFVSLLCTSVSFTGVSGQELLPPRWPQFRGVEGRAVAPDDKPLPVEFGPTKNVKWSTPLPSGLSSPCIWGEHIFVTGYDATKDNLQIICLNRANGSVRWRRMAPTKKIERVYKVNSPAAATPAADGKRLYVAFGSFGLLCYDFAGKELWQRALPLPPVGFGTAASPVVAGNLVLLNGQGKDLHLMAFHSHNGETAWTTAGTAFPSAFPAPFLWKHEAATEVIVPGRGGMMAYDFKDGSKRWWVPGLSPEANTTPTLGEGFLLVASHLPGGDPDLRMKLPPFEELLKHDKNGDGKISPKEAPDIIIFVRGGKEGVGEIHLHHMYWLFDKNGDGHIDAKEWQAMKETPFNNMLLAIRPGGTRDISKTHIAWQAKRGIPEVPSPLYYQGHIYMIRNGGMLTCLDAKTGKEAYRPERLGPSGMYYASPVAGDGKVYIASDSGTVIVLRAGKRFEVLAENDLGESIGATPALVDGVLYVRTAGRLYAFGE